MFSFMFAWMAHAPPVWANRATELLMVGMHAEGLEDGSGLGLSAVELDGFEVIETQVVRDRIRGRGPQVVDDALGFHGRSLLAEGRVLFDHANIEEADQRIGEAVISLEKAMAGSTDGRPLVEALLMRGNIRIAMDDLDGGREAFKRVVLMDPARRLDTVHYPPRVVSLFDEVRGHVQAVPTGTIQIEVSDPLASVHVDGRFVGKGAMSVKALPAGQHHVLVSGQSGKRDYAAVELRPGQKVTFAAPLRSFFIGTAGETEAQRETQTASLYRALGERMTEGLVLLAGETGADEVGVQLYEPRTGNFSIALRRESNGDPVSAVKALLPELESLLGDLGGLAPDAVSRESLGLDIGGNPTLSSALFRSQETDAPLRPIDAVGPLPPQESAPWAVWAGAGGMVVAATVVAFMLRPSDAGETERKSTGTGTVVVEF